MLFLYFPTYQTCPGDQLSPVLLLGFIETVYHVTSALAGIGRQSLHVQSNQAKPTHTQQYPLHIIHSIHQRQSFINAQLHVGYDQVLSLHIKQHWCYISLHVVNIQCLSD